MATPSAADPGTWPLSVPSLIALRALSTVVAPATVALALQGRQEVASVRATDRGIRAGVADDYAWGLRSGPIGAGSVELRAFGVRSLISGLDGAALPSAGRRLVFAINTCSPWSSSAGNEFDLALDTDDARKAEHVLTAPAHGLATTGHPNEHMACFVFRAAHLQLLAADFAEVPANSWALRCGVPASTLGLSPAGAPLAGATQAVSLVSAAAVTVSGVGTFDPFAPAISQGERVALGPGTSSTVPLSPDPRAAWAAAAW